LSYVHCHRPKTAVPTGCQERLFIPHFTSPKTGERFQRSASRSQLLSNCSSRIPNSVNRLLQFILRDAELLGPILHFPRLVYVYLAAVRRASLLDVVHLFLRRHSLVGLFRAKEVQATLYRLAAR